MQSDAPIAADSIVTLYRASLVATLDDPEEFVPHLTRAVHAVVPCLGVVIVTEPEEGSGSFRGQIETLENVRVAGTNDGDGKKSSRTGWIQRSREESPLALVMQRGEEQIAQVVGDRYPDARGLNMRWSEFEHQPRIGFCIFRPTTSDGTWGPFTAEEEERLVALEPHVAVVARMHVDMVRLRRKGFDFFAERCHILANEAGLTTAEFRVLRQMIAGASNAEISDELGTTQATVKTHITHILQKTGCRNRADLIGRYFSSRTTIRT